MRRARRLFAGAFGAGRWGARMALDLFKPDGPGAEKSWWRKWNEQNRYFFSERFQQDGVAWNCQFWRHIFKNFWEKNFKKTFQKVSYFFQNTFNRTASHETEFLKAYFSKNFWEKNFKKPFKSRILTKTEFFFTEPICFHSNREFFFFKNFWHSYLFKTIISDNKFSSTWTTFFQQ